MSAPAWWPAAVWRRRRWPSAGCRRGSRRRGAGRRRVERGEQPALVRAVAASCRSPTRARRQPRYVPLKRNGIGRRGTRAQPTAPSARRPAHLADRPVTYDAYGRGYSSRHDPSAEAGRPRRPRPTERRRAARRTVERARRRRRRRRSSRTCAAGCTPGTFPLAVAAGIVLVALAPTTAGRVVVGGLRRHRGAAVRHQRASTTAAPGRRAREVLLKRLDHSNIFLIIAGTYTPFALLLLPGQAAHAAAGSSGPARSRGVLFRVFWVGAPRWLYTPVYIALGWVAVFYLPDFYRAGGAALLAADHRRRRALHRRRRRLRPQAARPVSPRWFGFHEIFHACTVAAFVVPLHRGLARRLRPRLRSERTAPRWGAPLRRPVVAGAPHYVPRGLGAPVTRGSGAGGGGGRRLRAARAKAATARRRRPAGRTPCRGRGRRRPRRPTRARSASSGTAGSRPAPRPTTTRPGRGAGAGASRSSARVAGRPAADHRHLARAVEQRLGTASAQPANRGAPPATGAAAAERPLGRLAVPRASPVSAAQDSSAPAAALTCRTGRRCRWVGVAAAAGAAAAAGRRRRRRCR